MTYVARLAKARAIQRTLKIHGLSIRVEFERGARRSGTAPDGTRWTQRFTCPYGEIARTEGEDKEPVDVYLGLRPRTASKVYVVHQLKHNGTYDEDKVLLGFPSKAEAVRCYQHHMPEWAWGPVESMSVEAFVQGYLASNRKIGKGLRYVVALGKAAFSANKRWFVVLYQDGRVVVTDRDVSATDPIVRMVSGPFENYFAAHHARRRYKRRTGKLMYQSQRLGHRTRYTYQAPEPPRDRIKRRGPRRLVLLRDVPLAQPLESRKAVPGPRAGGGYTRRPRRGVRRMYRPSLAEKERVRRKLWTTGQ